MTDTKEILKKIAALRVRLDNSSEPANGISTHNITSEEPHRTAGALEAKVKLGAWHNALLDGTLRQLGSYFSVCRHGRSPRVPTGE